MGTQHDIVFSPISQHMITEFAGDLEEDAKLRVRAEAAWDAVVVRSPDGRSALVIDWEPA